MLLSDTRLDSRVGKSLLSIMRSKGFKLNSTQMEITEGNIYRVCAQQKTDSKEPRVRVSDWDS